MERTYIYSLDHSGVSEWFCRVLNTAMDNFMARRGTERRVECWFCLFHGDIPTHSYTLTVASNWLTNTGRVWNWGITMSWILGKVMIWHCREQAFTWMGRIKWPSLLAIVLIRQTEYHFDKWNFRQAAYTGDRWEIHAIAISTLWITYCALLILHWATIINFVYYWVKCHVTVNL